MKSTLLLTFAITIVLFGFCQQTHASLIGDEVVVEHVYGSQTFSVGGGPVTVQDGTSDTVSFAGVYSVNIDAESIHVVMLRDGYFPGDLNKIRISDLDWIENGPGKITNIVPTTNLSGVGYSFTDDSVTISLSGVSTWPGYSIWIDLETEHVPDGGVTLVLLGFAMSGLAAIGRKMRL